MTTTAEAGEREVHLRDYWKVLWLGKWMILAIALVVITLVAVATFIQTPIYRAKAEVWIQPRPKSLNPAADFSQLGTSSWAWAAEERYINTQMEIIGSRAIAQAAIDELGLGSAPRFASLKDPARSLAARVRVDLKMDTYVLEIAIEDADPAMAQLLVNGIVEAYIEANIESARAAASHIVEDLYDEVQPIRDRIAKQEQARIDLARDSAFYIPKTQESTLENRLKQLQNELTEVQIRRGEREAIFNAIEEIEQRGESYEALPLVANNPTIQSLKSRSFTLQQQLEELSLSYRDEHPKIIAAQSALAEIPGKIEEETAKIITNIKTEYAIDQRREVDLQQQLRTARMDGLGLSQASSQISTIDAEIREDRRIYELITTRIKEIDLNQETLVNNVRLLEEAILPESPVRPRRTLNLAAGIILGLFLGIGTVFFVDYLDNTIKTSEDIERFLKLPMLAMVPKLQKDSVAAVKEAFQTLRTSILFASKGRSLKTLLVTSAGPGEGKSRTIVNLAKTLASAGDQVVLIDGDLRRPTVHTYFGIERSGGLTNYLLNGEGGNAWLRYLKDAPEDENLKVLTCGTLPPNPVELFGSQRFAEMIEHLRENFSWVLIDSPPLASLSDSIVLGSMLEMTVVVIKHTQNDRELIRRTTDQLRKVNANVVGAVLNAVDLKRAGYHDYYYTMYHYNTGQGAQVKKKRKARPVGRRMSS
jgi:capsular exopolysaccharide synthesis family protein